MGSRGNQFQLGIWFVLVSYCYWSEKQWIGNAQGVNVRDRILGSTDEQIQRRLVLRRLSFSNPQVDKCTDFYGHVCSGVVDSEHRGPSVLSKESWHDILNTRLEGLISADVTPDDEPAIRKVKQQYRLCLDQDKRDLGDSESLKLLIQKDSDFPMIMDTDSWNPLSLRILEPQKYDPSLFSIRVQDNEIYIDKYDISAYGDGFMANLRHVSVISHPIKYKSDLTRVFTRFGLVDQNPGQLFDKDLDAVMSFRRHLQRLANVPTMPHARMTVGELQELVSIRREEWPELNWESFLRYVFVNATGIEINSQTEVNVEVAYVVALRDLFRQYGPRCIANHIKLHFLETYMPETSRSLIQIAKDLASAAHDSIGQRLRNSAENSCIYQPHMMRALNYMYLKKWFPKTSRDAALKMIGRIKNTLQDYVEATGMILADAFQLVQDKMQHVRVILGSEEKYADYDFLDPLYRYEVPEDHLSSVVVARRYLKDYEYSTLEKSKNTTLSTLAILEDTPYVSAEKGIMYLPIGYLHRANLSPTLSEEISYATLGYRISLFLNEVIIKEGFPPLKFSRESVIYVGDSHKYSNNTACIENQYHLRFPIRRLISDEELKIRYKAMSDRYVYDNAAFQTLCHTFGILLEDEDIPNRKRVSTKYVKQEFLTNWAHRYCMHDKEDGTNSSSLRVNNVLRNTDMFRWSFDCRNGTGMNPQHKCSFWS